MSSVAPFSGFGDAAVDSGRRTIPFDYAFRYKLTGSPSTVLNNSVTVSVEATFVAVSVGYGVIPEVTPVPIGLPAPPPTPAPATPPVIGFAARPALLARADRGALTESIEDALALASKAKKPLTNAEADSLAKLLKGALFSVRSKTVPEIDLGDLVGSIKGALVQSARTPRGDSILGAALRSGIRLNPRFADVALNAIEKGVALSPSIAARLFEVVSPPADQIQFLYALFDEGTGREFQSEPILNTAGLGISNGDRPFRYFPKPIVFKPRSTIRLQITEVSEFTGDLHISLQGYKVLGESGTPTASLRRRLRRRPGVP